VLLKGKIMQGRLENEIKKNKQIEEYLEKLPSEIKIWNKVMLSSNITASTRRDYVHKIGYFLSNVTNNVKTYDLHSLTKENFLDHMIIIRTREIEKDGVVEVVPTSDSYKITTWYCLNNFCDFLVNEGIIPQNYMAGIRKPKNKDLDRINENRVLLTEKDFKRILKVTENDVDSYCFGDGTVNFTNRNKCILMLLMTTGMRETALTEINLEDIDFESHILRIVDKGEKEHKYKLIPELIELITCWMEERKIIIQERSKETNALFVSSRGNRISNEVVVNTVRKYTKIALGDSLSPHKLRAGFCSILYQKTKDIQFVCNSVGHSNVSVTQRYIVTNKGSEMDETSKIMNELFAN
jgi:site-specific recombinase XerD